MRRARARGALARPHQALPVLDLRDDERGGLEHSLRRDHGLDDRAAGGRSHPRMSSA
jgi:hypothetical protein